MTDLRSEKNREMRGARGLPPCAGAERGEHDLELTGQDRE